jgi:hypothetical protein
MKIAIIGTGNVGSALTTALTRAGHDVTLAARDATKTAAVAKDLGVSAAPSVAAAASAADIVVLAVPFGALGDVARFIAAQTAGKLVIDVSNPLKPDYSGLATDGGTSAAEQVAEALPDAHVAKAFNTVFASLQANPTTHGVVLDALYATDNERAGETLADVIRSIGFRPVNAGPLQSARQMEALAWLNMSLQMRTNGDWRSTFVLVGAPLAVTEQPVAAGSARA